MHQLSVDALEVRYGSATAVDGINIEAGRGAVTAIVGSNGAGKSSTLLAIYGAVRCSGSIRLDGEEISQLSTAVRCRRGVALVPQGRRLFAQLSVRENLQVMAEFLGLGEDAVEHGLDRFPVLRKRSRQLAGVLSGGEQQMLAISRALLGSPRVLLLDEMTTGLAPIIVQELAEAMHRLARSGVVVVYAEPSVGRLGKWIDRGYVLVRGSVVASADGGGNEVDTAHQRVMVQALADTAVEPG